MTLRTRLLLALLALTAVGLSVAGSVTYYRLRGELVSHVDSQLTSALREPELFFPRFQHGPSAPDVLLPPGTYAELRDAATNSVVETKLVGFADAEEPQLPAKLPVGNTFTTRGPHTRALARPVPYNQGPGTPLRDGVVAVSIPMRDVDHTLNELFLTELVVALFVLAVLAGLSWWVVKLGLRPLERMEETAGAIAAGDLSQRVESTDPRTEVGRLGIALNSMLGQIEGAFAERAESEGRLRRFVADASHELRTPLTSIRGYAELFRRGADTRPEDLAKSMQRIEDAATRMGVLVDDLLLLARMDQGRPLEQEPVDLSRVASGAVEDARAATPDHEILYTSNGAVTIIGDESRLHQLFANLLSNACTHTPPGTPVHVRVEFEGDDAMVEVRDEGPGMSEFDAAHAFERFWRADESRTRESGGTGLGLSIVAAITDAHHGRAGGRHRAGRGRDVPRAIPARAGLSRLSADAASPTLRRPARRACRDGRRRTGARAPRARGRSPRARARGPRSCPRPPTARAGRPPRRSCPSDRGC